MRGGGFRPATGRARPASGGADRRRQARATTSPAPRPLARPAVQLVSPTTSPGWDGLVLASASVPELIVGNGYHGRLIGPAPGANWTPPCADRGGLWCDHRRQCRSGGLASGRTGRVTLTPRHRQDGAIRATERRRPRVRPRHADHPVISPTWWSSPATECADAANCVRFWHMVRRDVPRRVSSLVELRSCKSLSGVRFSHAAHCPSGVHRLRSSGDPPQG